ncbi:lymphotoxin-alpha [Austrofundulus limnaeus]|uniref:Lymphotoxin-alpha n=1 Tax=Austrofundulus limnaeus TaxID=52670 RepID=A0A2I4D0H9_AUSLI|nr:PREDICTED: lymphotoxin-alpha-like [Austrofundulus limnaeus]
MEKRSRDPQLVDDWEVSSMEEEGCRCGCKGGAEAGVHLQASLAQYARRRATRRRVAVAVVALLMLGVLAALSTVGLWKQWQMENSQLNSTKDIQPLDDGKHHMTPAYQQLKEYPRAKLTVLRESNDSETLQWESKKGEVYCNGGFLYADGDLVVPRTGFYRVYVQITYGNMDEKCPAGVMVLTHLVYCYQDGYQKYVQLLKAVDTVRCDTPWQKSIYSSAVFHLNANDRLRVRSTQPKNIMKNEHEAFFGAELLPD